MKYILTMIICSVVESQTTCIPPLTFETKYNDAYDCMTAGYKKSSEKILELGREDVNKYNIYIKFGCTPIPVKVTAV
mgnify:FL=1|tara:strand:- start:418 stop:648 length:231 start_codon:yes stop_codon:yes gene_type:complete